MTGADGENATIDAYETLRCSYISNANYHFVPIVNMKFSARYYLNLVLVDEENRRYFKQQEITIFRRQGNTLLLLNTFRMFVLNCSMYV